MSHASRWTNSPRELAQTGHIRIVDYTANTVDKRRKLAFVANLHGGVELKKCRKQGIFGSWDCLDNGSDSRIFYAGLLRGNISKAKIGGGLSR